MFETTLLFRVFTEAKRKDGALEAARSVFARLLECWAECGPAQLASAPELQAAQCLAAIATSANLLLQMQPALADGATLISRFSMLNWTPKRNIHEFNRLETVCM